MFLAALASAVAAEELRVGMETRTPPWSFIPDIDYSREDFTLNPRTTPAQLGKLKGIDLDVAAALGRRLGATIRIVPFAWFDLEEGLLAGRFDLILNAWTPSPKTPASILASAPYYEWGLLIAVHEADAATRSFQDLRGRRVGHYPDPAVERSLRARGQVQLVARDSPEALFEELRTSTLDAVVFDSPYVRWRVTQDSSLPCRGRAAQQARLPCRGPTLGRAPLRARRGGPEGAGGVGRAGGDPEEVGDPVPAVKRRGLASRGLAERGPNGGRPREGCLHDPPLDLKDGTGDHLAAPSV